MSFRRKQYKADRNGRLLRFFVAIAAVALLIAAVGLGVRAQTTTSASIQGTVTDPSGAAIAGAAVTVTNKGTGVSQNTVSDSQGRYQFAQLILGTYDLDATKDGFQKVVKTGIRLAVGTASVVDVALPVGQSVQTVTVEANNVQVETTTAQVSTLIDNKQLTDLPLNNRSLANLILLAPGVNVYTNSFTQGAFYGGGFTFSVGGGRPNGQAMVLDDSDVQDYYSHGAAGGALGTYMGVDAIGQFQVLTNTYSAQFGGAGSVVNQATKSGTNQFHGSAYEFFRNSAMDARAWFDGSRTAPYRKNQFGGALGGPIKKDKMFFFANYEGLRQLYAPAKVFTVPDSNTHNGLLPCNLLTASTPGNCSSAKAGTATPLVNRGVSPSIAPYLAFFDQFFQRPTTEFLSNGLPTGTGQETLFLPEVGSENYIVGRYDWNISDKDSLFARYLGDFSLLNNDNITGPWHPDLEYNRNQFGTVEEKHIFSANLLNVTRFAFSRPFQRSNPGSQRFPIFCYYTSAQCATLPSDGGFTYGGGLSSVGAGSPGPWRFNQNKFAVGDDVFWNHGAHSFKFGGEAKRVQSDAWSPLGLGAWSFGSLQNLLAAVPSSFAGVFLDSSGNLLDNSYRYFRETQFAMYMQDDWKILPTLTVNLGLRYEPGTNISEKNGNLNFILIPSAFINPALPGSSAYTNVPNVFANNPSLHSLDPRIGIAWDPFKDHKTSVRAGFGLFHNIIGPREYGAESYNNPPFKTGTALNPTFTVTENAALLTAAKPSQSFGLDYFIHNTPYVEQWNLTVQREVVNNTIVSLGYVGSHSVHQIVESNLNPVTCSAASAPCTAASTGVFATYNPAANTIVQSP
ncbi:MAG TPA: TonB-dependent receptor, partial [Terriglobales bacterium]|nr:TonB-dependent receptor [Terriglobales bacterium]